MKPVLKTYRVYYTYTTNGYVDIEEYTAQRAKQNYKDNEDFGSKEDICLFKVTKVITI